MSINESAVDEHYGRGGILESILSVLTATGKDINSLSVEDLAPVDEFHTRGRESTLELCELGQFSPDHKLLDVGCGLGGSVRHISQTYNCDITGIDLTDEYIAVATDLAGRTNLGDKVAYTTASALALPFENETFDRVWTEHAQMNIADKAKFYGEIARVLKPGGIVLFHDIFMGPVGSPYYPAPWAGEAAISSLATQDEAKAAISGAGLDIQLWDDKTTTTTAWFQAQVAKMKAAGGPPPLGLHLLMGPEGPTKMQNIVKNLLEDRINIVMGYANKI